MLLTGVLLCCAIQFFSPSLIEVTVLKCAMMVDNFPSCTFLFTCAWYKRQNNIVFLMKRHMFSVFKLQVRSIFKNCIFEVSCLILNGMLLGGYKKQENAINKF